MMKMLKRYGQIGTQEGDFLGAKTRTTPEHLRLRRDVVRAAIIASDHKDTGVGFARGYTYCYPYFPHSFDAELVKYKGKLAIYWTLPDAISKPLPKSVVRELEERFDLSEIREVNSTEEIPIPETKYYRYFIRDNSVIVHELSEMGDILSAWSDTYIDGHVFSDDLDTPFGAVSGTGVTIGIAGNWSGVPVDIIDTTEPIRQPNDFNEFLAEVEKVKESKEKILAINMYA